MKRPLFIFGAGGLGREVAAMMKMSDQWEVKGFYDDGLSKGAYVDGIEVVGGKEDLIQASHKINVVMALGDPRAKAKVAIELKVNPELFFPVLIHPTACLLDLTRIEIGAGTIVTAGCVVTTGVKIGSHVLINLNATIGHDARVGDYCSIMPGANLAGQVTLGKSVLVGSGANVLNRIVADENSVIGSGAVVTRNVEKGATVIGVPARKRNELK